VPLKQILFLMAAAGFLPVAWFLGSVSRLAEKTLLFLVLLLNVVDIDVTLLNQATYRGTTLGYEIGVVDVILLSLVIIRFTAPRWRGRPVRFLPHGWLLVLLFLGAGLPSLLLGPRPDLGLFEIWKYARGLLTFWVFANLVERPSDLRLLVYAILAGTVLTVLKVLYERYGVGLHRVQGFMGHANVTGVYLYMSIAFLGAWLLDGTKAVGIRWGVVLGGAVVGIILTLSRGAMAMIPVVLIALITLSLVHALWPAHPRGRLPLGPNLKQLGRVLAIVVLGVVATIPVAWKSADTIYKRFVVGNEKGTEGRMDKNAAALWMARDHIFGVGLNRFSLMATEPYKYAQVYQEDLPEKLHYRAPVHNLYLLVAAETGWYSVGLLVLILVVTMRRALHESRRATRPEVRAFAGGAMASLLALSVHGMLEYQLRVANIWILFFAILGTLAVVKDLNDQAQRPTERAEG
jgi:O-Antigen ligase